MVGPLLNPKIREGNQPLGKGLAETKQEKKENSKGTLNSHLASSLGCRENVTLFSRLSPWSVYLSKLLLLPLLATELEKGKNGRKRLPKKG